MVVEDVLVALPALDVEEDLHPGACAQRIGDLILGADGEGDAVLIVHDTDLIHDVTGGEVGVDHAALTLGLAVHVAVQEAIVNGGGEVEALSPLHTHATHGGVDGGLLGALVLADVADQLHEVVVEVTAPHHLQIAAVLVVGGVHEHDGTLGDPRPVARDPLVPARDQHDGRVGLDGAVELLGKVVALLPGIGLGIVLPIVVGAAAVGGLAVEDGITEADVAAVLGNGDVDDLVHAIQIGEDALGVGEVHPRPAAQLVGLVGPLGHLDVEEFLTLGGAFLLDRDDNGLTVQAEPGIGAPAGLIDGIVDIQHGQTRGGIGVEHDLGDLPALVVVLLQHPHDQLGVLAVDSGVGGVEEEEVHVGLHEELHVAAHHPLVIGVVVAVEGLAPMVVDTVTAPQGRGGLMADVGVLGGDLGDIVGLMAAMLAQPEEVEHTDQTVLAADGRAAVGIGGGSAQGIDGHKGAARNLLLVICHCETPFGVCIQFSR